MKRTAIIARSAACCLMFALAACAPARGQGEYSTGTVEASPATTIVLVRHGEKAAEPENDPPLSDAGRVRAQALLAALGNARIDAIYSTQYERTRMTAQPLADVTGIELTIVRADRDAPPYIQTVAERARTEYPGGVVVIVGHSNTLGPTIAALGGPDDIGELPDEAYDRFFIVMVQDGEPTRLIRARFGAATP